MKEHKTIVVGLEHFVDKIGYQSSIYKKNGISVRYLVSDTSGFSTEKAAFYDSDIYIVPRSIIMRIIITFKQFSFYKPQYAEIYHIGRLTAVYFLIAKLFRAKSILILRGGELSTSTRVEKISLNLSMALSSHIIAKEYNILKDLESVNVNPYKISFLHNAVWIPSAEDIIPINQRNIDLLYLNSVRKKRNVDVLVDAIEKILLVKPSLNVVIAGFTSLNNSNYKMEVDYESQILDMIEQKGLSKHIQILGFVNNPADYFRDAKIFIFPADIVFLNYALLEAMSYGVIPVVSDGEGADKIISSNVNGFIVKRNSNDIENTVIEVLSSQMETVSTQARKTIVDKFNIHGWFLEMMRIRSVIE